jgi:curved DNA-binding protein CbpA
MADAKPPSLRDPYSILGLDHNASSTQIKLAYRKLALKYHPDRQQHSTEQQKQEATNKFAELSSAYAILSDPTKKSQYDHLYKFGAFDNDNVDEHYDRVSEMRDDTADSCYNTGYRNHNTSSGSGYQYTENYSGGYYTNKATSATNPTTSAPPTTSNAPFVNFYGINKADSFFDDLLNSPKNSQQQERTNSQQQKQRKRRSGIGFSFRPMGQHLSIHVPSKTEIMTSMASGESLPHFGGRVTFTKSESCQKRKSFVSTTTRLAHGQQRTITRTVHIQPDGKKEEVIEENGVVKRRHVEELCPPQPPLSSKGTTGGVGETKEGDAQRKGLQENNQATCNNWHSGVICGLRDCALGSCLGLQGV